VWHDSGMIHIGLVLLRAYSIAGEWLCEFRVGMKARVGHVKQRISLSCGIPLWEQRLVLGGRILRDACTLEECHVHQVIGGYVDGFAVVSIQCVRGGQSQLSRDLGELAGLRKPDIAVDASLSAVADAVMRAEHELSERAKPADPLALLDATPYRVEFIHWMMQAFDILRFDPSILHGTVLTLDRFFSRQAAPVDPGKLNDCLLACVSIEMKLAGADEFPPEHCKRLLAHLSHHRAELPTIMSTEYEILSCIDFGVGIPTTLTFFRELALRPQSDDEGLRTTIHDLGLFFLDLCMFEPRVQYGCPHGMLAAGALAAAVHVLDGDSSRKAGCAEVLEHLFENVAAYGISTVQTIGAAVFGCEEIILELWCARALGESQCPWSECYRVTAARHERQVFARGGILLDAATASSTRQRFRRARSGCQPEP